MIPAVRNSSLLSMLPARTLTVELIEGMRA